MAKFSNKLRISSKHIQVDKANQTTVIAVSVAAALVIFSLIATQALVKQMKYQNTVIGLRSSASKVLKNNLKARATLVNSYKTFDEAPESVIGTKEKNSKIILDALPSKYDYPAIATSLQSLILGSGLSVNTISGTDNEAAAEQESVNPTVVDIPFSIAGSGKSAAAQTLLTNIEKSIRPITVNSVKISAGKDDTVSISVEAKTAYQPSRILEIKESVIKNGSTAKNTKSSPTGATNK